MKKLLLLFIAFLAIHTLASAQEFKDKFRQLEEILPTPNEQRTASGAPGHEYWQQQADYKMALDLNDDNQSMTGDETITYHNNSPDPLSYVWLQLDQNIYDKNSDASTTRQEKLDTKLSFTQLDRMYNTFDGGFKIDAVKDAAGAALPYTIVKTMMRVDLPKPLKHGEVMSFKVVWHFNIVNRLKLGGRSGLEYFPDDKNYAYTMAQFYPRMCVYSDVTGWQNKQFLGAGEFTLTFGNYEVALTTPADHIVGATGQLQNSASILTAEQISRWNKAKVSYDNPVQIVTEADARAKESVHAKEKKTWVFKAENVRDFAFCSSRKYIWDAMGVKQKNGSTVMAMSFYQKESVPLWDKYSTKVIAHTLKWYSHYTFDYPYPVAISVDGANGMEYPMICFNNGRPEKDGTYSERVKYGMISVIIHEVGHNYFPMIVNSDERQWTWMDEGLNSFLEFLAEQQWERDYPSRRGPAANIVDYMKGDKSKLEPIMTNSESIRQFGNNAYGKPATALNILRETVMGRELFDYAFKTYANRWMFKHPMPADFFRTMEDASAVDLDWFWRGWFYTTDYVDIAVSGVKTYKVDSKNPDVEIAARKAEAHAAPRNIISLRNEKEIGQTTDEQDRSLRDFYTNHDYPFEVAAVDKDSYTKYYNGLTDSEKALLQKGDNYYELTFDMIGELVSPIVVQLQFTDGTQEDHYIPAEIWRMGDKKVAKVFHSPKELKQVVLDPYLETADVDVSNNYFPPKVQASRFEVFKAKNFGADAPENAMQKMKKSGSK